MASDTQLLALSKEELEEIVATLSGSVYQMFRGKIPFERGHYYLHVEALVSAISDAATDLGRAASYHSDSGASDARIAGYIGWWIALTRPIQLDRNTRMSEYNDVVAKDLLGINAIFAVYCVKALMGDSTLSAKLLTDLKYSFQFRPRFDGEAIAMLLANSVQTELIKTKS